MSIAIHRHHVVIGAAVLGLALLLLGMMPSPAVEARRIPQPLLDGEQISTDIAPVVAEPAPRMIETPPAAAAPQAEAIQVVAEWQDVRVRSGDNLSLVFARLGLSPRDVYAVMHGPEPRKELTRLYPGQQLSVRIDASGSLNALRLCPDRLHEITYQRNAGGYQRSEAVFTPEHRPVYRQARLENSLFLAGAQAGLPDGVIMELADIFSGVIDFVLDPRQGDTFSVLYEELWLDDEKIGNGSILAAQYVNVGTPFSAFRYVDRNGDSGYYDADGVSMQRAFLRAPLDFRRISSNFNLRRMHPVLHQVRAHRGIDYAANTGTPVFAAGDGRVIASGYSSANGNYVFIQHGEKYTTKYLHLSKRRVKTGQRVKQKQVIGNVGATGLANGPHLHYEFLVNGVHRNPRTIVDQLPRARSIEAAERPRFELAVLPFEQKLASYQQAWQLAQAGSSVGD